MTAPAKHSAIPRKHASTTTSTFTVLKKPTHAENNALNSMPYSPELRNELKLLLQRICGQKLILGNPERVRRLGNDALEMSRNVGAPWEQLAAYRLAHVLLREPSTDEDNVKETERLKQIAANFKLAADYERNRLFGPLPHIYLIAVLNRLIKHDPDNALDYQQGIQTHFAKAATLTSQLDLPVANSNHSETRQLQHNSFNLLELASYCLDLDYSVLRGRGGLTQDTLFLSGSWRIVSNNTALQAIDYDLEFGLAELEELLANSPNSIGFIFGDAPTIRNGWKCSGQEAMNHQVNDDYLRLLSIILKEPRLAQRSHANERNSHFENPEDGRQIKRRCKNALISLTGVDGDKIFPGDTFDLKIPIYGLINGSILSRRR